MSSSSVNLQKQNYKSADRYKVWLSQAHFDLDAAEESYNSANYEWSCYQSVQSVEKALKAVVIHAGWRPPQTHKLGVLLSMCNRANTLFVNVKFNYRKIESYTFISRYPFVYPGQNKAPHDMINKQDADTCISIARDIYFKVDEFLTTGAMVQGQEIDMENYYYSAEDVDKRISHVVEELKNSDKIDVRKVILYGSFAREKTRPKTSTMDLLIIAVTELNFIERMEHVRNLTKDEEPLVEPLIYTPEEFDFMLKEEGEGFLESAIDEGRVVYETSGVRDQASEANVSNAN